SLAATGKQKRTMKKAGRVARDTGHFSWALALFSEDYTTIRLRKCAAKAVLDYGFCGMSWLQDKDHPRGPSKCYIAGYVWQVCFFSSLVWRLLRPPWKVPFMTNLPA